MYAAQCTRADISFAVSKLSRFISNPSVEHWKAIGRVLGWVFTLGGGAVSWGSKKQTCISHSTMEAEFIVLAATGKEAEWLRDLMMDIPFTANNVSTVSIHCDSQATLARVVPPLMRVGVSFKKVHEWIEHMTIKVVSKKIMGTRVVSGSVCVVTGFVTRNNWFNATSNLGFQQSFVTITLRKVKRLINPKTISISSLKISRGAIIEIPVSVVKAIAPVVLSTHDELLGRSGLPAMGLLAVPTANMDAVNTNKVLMPRAPGVPRSCQMDGCATSTNIGGSRAIITLRAADRDRGRWRKVGHGWFVVITCKTCLTSVNDPDHYIRVDYAGYEGASCVSGWGDPDGMRATCHYEVCDTCSQEEGSL
ncbi:hypothetical protein CK203_029843 [Vitis vinifera]|uniref:Retrovirus-related Pol polyprotein from transposon TNT 1-94 n=1 Tax=Vitis vinifera TaxID=29760 RepID=A0A438IE69_VITVI|nr:hypothetical protein CK203_029843 [Vitis vinifera]